MSRLCFVVGCLVAMWVPSAVWAANWTVRPAESSIAITATQQGANFTGGFKKFETQISFDPADLAHSSVAATIDMSSFDSRSSDRDAQVQTPDWFAVAKFPAAKFTAKSFKSLGGGTYQAIGTLTIRDVTKDVVLPFTLTIDGSVAKMSGSLTLIRGDYGVGQGQWATTDWVGPSVKVDIKLVADRAG